MRLLQDFKNGYCSEFFKKHQCNVILFLSMRDQFSQKWMKCCYLWCEDPAESMLVHTILSKYTFLIISYFLDLLLSWGRIISSGHIWTLSIDFFASFKEARKTLIWKKKSFDIIFSTINRNDVHFSVWACGRYNPDDQPN